MAGKIAPKDLDALLGGKSEFALIDVREAGEYNSAVFFFAVIDNSITETRYRRVDDREEEDRAVLERDREVEVKPGDISLLIPEVDEIHQMDNYNDRPTVEIHVYGHDLRGLERSSFDLETGAVKHFATTSFNNC